MRRRFIGRLNFNIIESNRKVKLLIDRSPNSGLTSFFFKKNYRFDQQIIVYRDDLRDMD